MIAWLRLINRWFNLIYLSLALALFAFVIGALISGFWLSLVGLIWWEKREDVRIVKQGNKFIAFDQDEVYPPKPGNT